MCTKTLGSFGLEEGPAGLLWRHCEQGSCHRPCPDPLPSALWQDASSRGSGGRERLIVEPPLPQEKAGAPAIPSHLLSAPYPFGISPSSAVQDSRFPPLK